MTVLHSVTPTLESKFLSAWLGKPVYLKMDFYQPAGSFKIRGLGKLCQEYAAQGKSYLVSSSGGNAGYATAFAARKLGLKCTVFIPRTSAQIFVDHIKSEGADVVVAGDSWDEANVAAQEYLTSEGGFVHPFDHPAIWSGHSTIIDECAAQIPKPASVIASIGGGGLACGILEGMVHNNWSDVGFVGVEPIGAASLAASVAADKLVSLSKTDTIASSLAAKRVCAEILNWTKKHPMTLLCVDDGEIEKACKFFARDHRVLLEPACAAALVPIYEKRREIDTFSSILVIICGGVGASTCMR